MPVCSLGVGRAVVSSQISQASDGARRAGGHDGSRRDAEDRGPELQARRPAEHRSARRRGDLVVDRDPRKVRHEQDGRHQLRASNAERCPGRNHGGDAARRTDGGEQGYEQGADAGPNERDDQRRGTTESLSQRCAYLDRKSTRLNSSH